MKQAFVALLAFTALGIWAAPTVHATGQTNAHLQVLPLACLFDTVADGSNEVVYLTPQECGQNGQTAQPTRNNAAVPDQPVAQNAETPTEASQTTPPSPPAPDQHDGTANASDERNTIGNTISEFSKVGEAITNNPVYSSIVALVVLPTVMVAANFLTAGRLVPRLLSFLRNILLP